MYYGGHNVRGARRCPGGQTPQGAWHDRPRPAWWGRRHPRSCRPGGGRRGVGRQPACALATVPPRLAAAAACSRAATAGSAVDASMARKVAERGGIPHRTARACGQPPPAPTVGGCMVSCRAIVATAAAAASNSTLKEVDGWF